MGEQVANRVSVVVFCHRDDYVLAKVCIASIRYYYPSVEIFLVKDRIHGDFSIHNLCKHLNVKELCLGHKKYGWTTAKLLVHFSSQLRGKRCLVLDSDTAFIGFVLDKIKTCHQQADFIVSPDYYNKPGGRVFDFLYYDVDWVRKYLVDFEYPGFAFNTGCIVITPGLVSEKDLAPFFCTDRYPFWKEKHISHFPSRDQSLLNIVLPFLCLKKKIRLKCWNFMYWSEYKMVKERITLNEIKEGKRPRVIHWAGARQDLLINMTRSDILMFFLKYYYSQLPWGGLKYRFYLTKQTLLWLKGVTTKKFLSGVLA